ncbi:peptidylprolyl isomerase, partial [Candidatus Woesearchaeota archaeon]|nr:peptidylprolyl isomerase [Candidatus Woesearchaeota archaeon]
MKTKNDLILFLGAASLIFLLASCGGNNEMISSEKKAQASNSIAAFETSLGNFEIELFEDKAPVTTKNFIDL